LVNHGRRAAQAFALLTCVIQTGTDSLAKNLAFELGEHSEQSGHRTTGRRGQIECFRQRYEAHSEMLKFV
jgi:hypothetical protein